MSTVIDVDSLPRMKAAKESVGEISGVIKKAVNELYEICKETGIPNLVKTAEGAVEGTEEMAKCADEVAESLEKSINHFEREAAAYGL